MHLGLDAFNASSLVKKTKRVELRMRRMREKQCNKEQRPALPLKASSLETKMKKHNHSSRS
jgi:hypothetical protein